MTTMLQPHSFLRHALRRSIMAVAMVAILFSPVVSFSGRVNTKRGISSFPCVTTTSLRTSTFPNRRHRIAMLPPNLIDDASSFWNSAVPVFDGSTIVDPVVVSGVFWANIRAKLVTLLIAQTIATVIFCIVAAVFGPQVTQWGNALGKMLRDKTNETLTERTTPLLRRNSLRRLSSVQPDFGKLLICVFIDIIGSSSELVPILGETTDILWAPIAGFILRSLYGSTILFVLEFLEEILPFTDVLPLATITWVVDAFFADSDLAQLFQVGLFNPRINGTSSFTSREERLKEQSLLPKTNDKDEGR